MAPERKWGKSSKVEGQGEERGCPYFLKMAAGSWPSREAGKRGHGKGADPETSYCAATPHGSGLLERWGWGRREAGEVSRDQRKMDAGDGEREEGNIHRFGA